MDKRVTEVKILKTVSVVDALTDSLRKAILDGEVHGGATLTENEVAEEYDVSRPTAKAAISVLTQQGLLRREAHKAARVPNLSKSDVEDLFFVRILLELEAVHLVVSGHIVPESAGKAIQELSELPPDSARSALVEADLRFHQLLIQAVNSPRLERVYSDLSGEIHLSMVQAQRAMGYDRIVAEHSAIFDAVAEKDVERAQYLMRKHLEGARAALIDEDAQVPRSG